MLPPKLTNDLRSLKSGFPNWKSVGNSTTFFSTQRHVHGRFRQFGAETAMVEFSHDRPLELVALVDEREPEGKTDILEDIDVLGPGDHRARAHDRREVAVHE